MMRERERSKMEAPSSFALRQLRGTSMTSERPRKYQRLEPLPIGRNYLQPGDIDFHPALETSYRGFCLEKASAIPQEVHARFTYAFDALHAANAFHYDVVQAGGKILSKTFVRRTLLGVPGITYKYLGLRIFAHPWTGEVAPSKKSEEAFRAIGQLNETLIRRSEDQLRKLAALEKEEGGSSMLGSTRFNLTLINQMEPLDLDRKLRPEPLFDMGKCSVSWHADSGLQDFSSIAVYHVTQEKQQQQQQQQQQQGSTKKKAKAPSLHTSGQGASPWRVALRVTPQDGEEKDSGSVPPPVVIPTSSGELYYLLDDFNHHHQHAVLAGRGTLRYSSTHRVAKEEGHTFAYISRRCRKYFGEADQSSTPSPRSQGAGSETSCKAPSKKRKGGSAGTTSSGGGGTTNKSIGAMQALLNEVEFEWVRQWHIQGALHARLHTWWMEADCGSGDNRGLDTEGGCTIGKIEEGKEEKERKKGKKRKRNLEQKDRQRGGNGQNGPIPTLIGWWRALEAATLARAEQLKEAAASLTNSPRGGSRGGGGSSNCHHKTDIEHRACTGMSAHEICSGLGDLALHLEERARRRTAWETKETDRIWSTLPLECRPIALPLLSNSHDGETHYVATAAHATALVASLRTSLRDLRAALAAPSSFLSSSTKMGHGAEHKAGSSSFSSSKSFPSQATIQGGNSNWAQLQARLKKQTPITKAAGTNATLSRQKTEKPAKTQTKSRCCLEETS